MTERQIYLIFVVSQRKDDDVNPSRKTTQAKVLPDWAKALRDQAIARREAVKVNG